MADSNGAFSVKNSSRQWIFLGNNAPKYLLAHFGIRKDSLMCNTDVPGGVTIM